MNRNGTFFITALNVWDFQTTNGVKGQGVSIFHEFHSYFSDMEESGVRLSVWCLQLIIVPVAYLTMIKEIKTRRLALPTVRQRNFYRKFIAKQKHLSKTLLLAKSVLFSRGLSFYSILRIRKEFPSSKC